MLEELNGKVSGVEAQINSADARKQQYQQVLKYLFTMDAYADLGRTRNALHIPWRKKRFDQAHSAELASFDRARAQLTQCGISETVSMDKVTDLIQHQKNEINDLENTKRVIERRISKLRAAQEEINRQQNDQTGQEHQSPQRKQREESL